MKVIAATCAILAIVPRICLSDDLIRCGGGLVSADMPAADFLTRCGKPSSQSASTQDLRDEYGVKVGTMTTEIWRYDGDSTVPRMTVTVVDGQIQSIERRN